jgi:hypothetical protein
MISTVAFVLAVAVPFLCAVGGLLLVTVTGLAHYRTP